jgi:hypothetical protein
MGDYDPTELIGLCEEILSDGEVSGDELYQLAEWLNQHPEAGKHWPGDALVGPLQEAWAGGKLTKTEIRKIGRLLTGIAGEWPKMQQAAELAPLRNMAAQAIASIDLGSPQLPSICANLHIKSHSQAGVTYEVNLQGPSCSCQDWLSMRQQLAPLHLTRCCKHILDAFRQIEPSCGWPGWLSGFLNDSHAPKPGQEWMLIDVSGKLVLASTAPFGWSNVYVANGSSYERFGYNPAERRWAYGEAPRGARTITEAVHRSELRAQLPPPAPPPLPPASNAVLSEPLQPPQREPGIIGWFKYKRESKLWEQRVKEMEQAARWAEERQRRATYLESVAEGLRAGRTLRAMPPGFLLQEGEMFCWAERACLYEVRTRQGNRTLHEVSRGDLIITSKRIGFLGDRKSFAVAFAKLLEMQQAADGLKLSENGKATSKFVKYFNAQAADEIRLVLGHVFSSG